MIITIASQKGGVGKSTVAINLALIFASHQDCNVALVDCDVQRSSVDTMEGHSYSNLSLHAVDENPHRAIEKIKADYVIVDTPPHSHEIMFQAAAVSDMVIIPLQPSVLDVRGVARTIAALLEIQSGYNTDLLCRLLINRFTPNAKLSAGIRDVLVDQYPYPVFKTALHNREAYKQSLILSQSVVDFAKNSPAAHEIADLVKEIITELK